MKIEKKAIRSGMLKMEKNVQITLDEDMNVPDTRQDVDKIIDSRGEIHIDEIEVQKDKVRIRGSFLVRILYLSAEKEQKTSCMDHEFLIEETMNVEGAEPDDMAKVQADIEDLSVSIINSRKCGIRSVLFFHIRVSEMKFVEASVGTDSKNNVQCLYEGVPMTEIVMNKKDIQRVRAEVSLPAGKSNIKEILWNSLSLREVDVRMMDGKLSIRGEMYLFVLFEGEDEKETIQYYDWEIPFSNELECADSEENLIGNISAALGNHQVNIKPDQDGELRNVEAEAVLELDLKAYREFELSLLEDMYATNRRLELKRKPVTFENLIFQNNAKTKVIHRASTSGDVHNLLQVLNVEGNLRIEDFRRQEEGVLVEGLVFARVLYISADDGNPIQMKELVIPFEYLVEVRPTGEKDRCEVKGVLEQIGGYVVDGNELEIRAVAGIYVTGYAVRELNMIEEAEEKPYGPEELSKIPSITGYMIKSGDTLWDIAKKYKTTIRKIRQYNEGAEEPLEEGKQLFLIKEMESLIGE